MELIKRIWHYFVADPFTWVFYYFCQPSHFRREFETMSFAERIVPMLRLALPIFIVSYPLTFFSTWWAIILGTISGIILGVIGGLRWGIIGGIGLSVGLGLGLSVDMFTISNLSIMLIGFGAGLGIGMGIIGDILGDIIRRILGSIEGVMLVILGQVASCILLGLGGGFGGGFGGAFIGLAVESIANGGLRGVTEGILLGSVIGILGCLIYADSQKGTKENTPENTLKHTVRGTLRYSAWVIAGCCLGSAVGVISWYFLGSDPGLTTLAIEWLYNGSNNVSNVSASTIYASIGFILGGVSGATIGIILAIMYSLRSINIDRRIKQYIDKQFGRGIDECIGLSIGWGILVTLESIVTFDSLTTIPNSILKGISAAFVFIVYYLFSYYQAPSYLISSISTFRAKEASKNNPLEVFRYLHCCALYWNETLNLPLPFLKNILLIAIELNIDQVLKEITFIKTDRPHQLRAARVSLIEVIIQDLEKRRTLRDLAEARQQLAQFLERGRGVLDPKWEAEFTDLYNASSDTIHYLTSLRWQARYDALINIIANLEQTTAKTKEKSSKNLSLEDKLEQRLGVKIDKWLGTTQSELDKLNQEPEKTDQINNPYIVGPVLDQLGTSLFVGRRDLARQLEQALRRGSQRSTFFLNGERRMGKSSTLKQLPYLLDSHYYLPIFYDLQAPEMSSSIAAFLGSVAEKIWEAVHHEIQLECLEKGSLQEANQKSEAEVYFVFDNWLKKVELLLEQKNWTLLLSFDEFEHLEKVAEAKYLDLHLLLSWFRNVIQYRHRLALLFSGGRSAREMSTESGINWASYFVNVQTLRVSFLQETEARQLITHPIPDYPIEQIFGEGVVDEIIRVTGCHPFLVQAVCSALIDNLNADKRERAIVKDVAIAVDQILENWETYFHDLWDRTDQNQRISLFAIGKLGKGNLQQIAQLSSLDERIVYRTLETLRRRDLVLQEDENYRIAAPIFTKWVERNY